MTREDLIKLARDAGIEFQQHKGITGAWNTSTCGSQAIQKMERFAALVAAAEREACIHAAEVAISLVCDPVKAIRARGQS